MKILLQNNKYSIISEFTIIEKLENGYYKLDWDAFGNLFLEKMDTLKLPEKVYDVNSKTRNLILNSFNTLDKNLGVVLQGDKGTGKSVDAKLICANIAIPKILITKAIPKNIDFKAFLDKIEQPYLLFIDEFEKRFQVYDNDEGGTRCHTQDDFLSIMSGLEPTNKILFLFTVNGRISEFMMNRPSRVKYLQKYKGISEDLAKQVIIDNLINKDNLKDLLDNIDLSSLTVDILMTIIEEMNVNNVSYSDIKEIFNYTRDSNNYVAFERFTATGEFEPNETIEIPEIMHHGVYIEDEMFQKVKHLPNGSIIYRNSTDINHQIKFVKSFSSLAF